jgi:endopolyphosphatase
LLPGTGDNARHDSDRKIPRTLKEIYDLNGMLATDMENIFLKKGVPVIPSLGNNDIWRMCFRPNMTARRY